MSNRQSDANRKAFREILNKDQSPKRQRDRKITRLYKLIKNLSTSPYLRF
jgi:uncharacterized protein YjbK